MNVKITGANGPFSSYYFASQLQGPLSLYAPIGTVIGGMPREYYDEQCMTRMGPCLGPGLFPFPGNPWSQQDNANYISWAQFSGGQPCGPIMNE